MATTVTGNKRYLLSGAAVAVVAIAAYGLGRVYPPQGPSAGTVTAADRYVSPQVQEGDVTLGDTSVAELMQTDAFELLVRDPELRALAASPGFKALSGQPQVMAALLSNPQAFSALAANPKAFEGLAKAAQSASASRPQAREANAKLMSAIAAHPAAMEALAAHPQALAAIGNNASAFANLASNANAFRDAVSRAASDARLANNASAFQQ